MRRRGPLARSRRGRRPAALFAGLLVAAAAAYLPLNRAASDVVHRRFVQDLLDQVMNVDVGSLRGVRFSSDGRLVLEGARLSTRHGSSSVSLFEADSIELDLVQGSGTPGEPDSGQVRVLRVDVFKPHFTFARGPDGIWNVDLAFRPRSKVGDSPRPGGGAAKGPPSGGGPGRETDHFPPQGIHIRDGSLSVRLARNGGVVEWNLRDMNYSILKLSGKIVVRNADSGEGVEGDFYGGRMYLFVDLRSLDRGVEGDLRARLVDARLEQLTEGLRLSRPVRGNLRAYLTLRRSFADTEGRVVGSGNASVSEGDLYEYPLVVGALSILNLGDPGKTKIDEARLEFNVHRYEIDIPRMDFFSDSISLYGDGVSDLFGSDMDVVLVPGFGRGGSFNPLGLPLKVFGSAHLEGSIGDLRSRVVPLASAAEARQRIRQEALMREKK